MTFRQILAIINARRLLALSVLVAVVAISLAVTYFVQKQYRASASVVVEVKSDPLATSMFSEANMSSYLGTQVDIASSERVALRVVKALKIDDVQAFRDKWQDSEKGRGDFDAWLARTLLSKVSVKPSPQSNVIEISVKWPDAKAAATLANAFAQAYIDTNVALKVEMAKEYANFFKERAVTLRGELEAKQNALSDFENRTGIVATDDKLDVENARLTELSTQLVAVQGQRQDSESRQTQEGHDEGSMPEVIQNPLVVSLKGELSRSEAREKDLETSLGTKHPAYQAADAEVMSLRARLAQEQKSIVASLGNVTRVNQHRETDIKTALDAQKSRILELKHQRDQVAVLQSDVATAQRNLDAVTQRLAQSNLEGATEQTNIALLTPATEPPEHSSPSYVLVLILSILGGSFLGFAAALARELSDPRIRSDDELPHLLGVPFFGSIEKFKYPLLEGSAATRTFFSLKPSGS